MLKILKKLFTRPSCKCADKGSDEIEKFSEESISHMTRAESERKRKAKKARKAEKNARRRNRK